MVAGAVAVLAGAAGAWTATRVLGGQSPLTTLNVTTAGVPVTTHSDSVGFTVPVPQNWTEYRNDPVTGEPSVSFASPEGSEELTVARTASTIVTDIPGSAVQLSYAAGERVSWRRVLPADAGVWTVTLTVRRSPAGAASEQLFDVLADGFTTTNA